MSSGCKQALLRITLLVMPIVAPTAARAQESAQAEAEEMAAEQQAELRDAIAPQDCARDEFQPDTIVVCGENSAEETREHMSVLPRPVASDRVIQPGLNDPPCWVVPTGSVCIRGGWAPPPVVLIDLDQFPDALTPEKAAQVYAVEEGD